MEMNGTSASPAIARATSVLPGAGRPDEEHALGDTGADPLEPLRLLQELHQLGDLLLDVVVAGDVRECSSRAAP